MTESNSNIKGISFLIMALFVISIQNVLIKWISGSYSALEIVAIRSIVALPCTVILFYNEGKKGLPKTQHRKLEYIRGFFLFLSYTTYMMGLAALSLAEIEAIRYSGPLIITLLSVILLKEHVGLKHWLAILIGFIGVILIVQPGSANFKLGSIFVLVSVFFYAMTAITTRKLQSEDSSATMAYFGSQIYLVAAFVLIPLPFLFHENPNSYPSIAFVLRPWSLPTFVDLFIIAGLGLIWAVWMYLISHAYSLSEASVLAPFEYASLPINIIWGFLIWQEIPTLFTIAGALLTLISGLYIVYNKESRPKTQNVVN